MDLVILLCFSALLVHIFVDSRNSVSDEKCEYYRNIIPSLPREFNETDEEAGPKEFPFMARIENGSHYFNGILISDNFVLSTAQFMPWHESSRIFVVLGDSERDTSTDDTEVQTYDVIKVIVHPDFNYDDHRSDIRLFKLNQSVQFNEYVRPACLSPFLIQSHLTEIGWSKTSIRNTTRLHKVKLNYISNERCKEAYKSEDRRKIISSIDNATIFCAGTNKGDRVMCAGFAGSAVINADRMAFDEIVGIASYNFKCYGGSPDVFVSVLAYINWIESIVWPIEPKESFPIKYILLSSAGIALVLISIWFIVCLAVLKSRNKQNHQNAMDVHMHVTG